MANGWQGPIKLDKFLALRVNKTCKVGRNQKRWAMSFNRYLLSVSALLIHLLFFCAAVSLFAANKPKDTDRQMFVAGTEVRVDVNDKNIGGDYFVVYVPLDYTEQHDWPVIFFYNGVGGKPSTSLFRENTGGKGFVIIGVEYIDKGKDRMTPGQYINYLKSELRSIKAVRARVSKHLRLDKKRLFITGFSKGGWLTSDLVEQRPKAWAGAAIFCAGRRGYANVTTAKKMAMRGRPIYIGAGERERNLTAAKRAAAYYRRLKANVTFEMYKGLGHIYDPHSKTLHNWLLANSVVKDAKSD